MVLTKKRAIEEHRKMWNWIAEEGCKLYFENGKESYLSDLKRAYMEKFFPEEDILQDCFCCEYSRNARGRNNDYTYNICKYCPLDWGNGGCSNIDSPYDILINYIRLPRCSSKQFKSLALQIANLPER